MSNFPNPDKVINNLQTALDSLKSITNLEGNLTDVVGAIPTPDRAETTLDTVAKDNKLEFTASNIQETGYVFAATSGNDVKTKTVSLSVAGNRVTASDGSKSISATVDAGSVSASASVNSPEITLTPSAIGLTNKTATVTGKTQVTATPSTNSNGVAKYYVAVEANTSATNSSKSITATANANIGKDGYLYTTDSKSITASGTASATIAATVTTHYIPLTSGSYSISGGGLSGAGALTPTISFTNGTVPEGVSIGANDNNYDRHIKITATSSTSSKTITRAAVTSNIGTAGYIDSTTNKPGIEQAQATVTVNQGSGDTYVNMKNASYTVSGGGLTAAQEFTPTLTLSSGNENNMGNNATISTTKDTTNYPYWFKVTATNSITTKSVTREAVTATQSAGYLSSATTAQQKINSATTTVEVKQGTGDSYVGIKAGGYHHAGGTVTATNSASGTITATGITLTATNSQPASAPYLKVDAIGSVSMTAVTATQTAGYIAGSTTSSTIINAIDNRASNATQYYTIDGVSCNETTIGLDGKQNESDKIVVSASNTYPTGYVTGATMSATETISLAVSTTDGAIVEAKNGTTLLATCSVATTTMTKPSITLATIQGGLILATAENNQEAGYATKPTTPPNDSVVVSATIDTTPTYHEGSEGMDGYYTITATTTASTGSGESATSQTISRTTSLSESIVTTSLSKDGENIENYEAPIYLNTTITGGYTPAISDTKTIDLKGIEENLKPENIKEGVSIFGVGGQVIEAPVYDTYDFSIKNDSDYDITLQYTDNMGTFREERLQQGDHNISVAKNSSVTIVSYSTSASFRGRLPSGAISSTYGNVFQAFFPEKEQNWEGFYIEIRSTDSSNKGFDLTVFSTLGDGTQVEYYKKVGNDIEAATETIGEEEQKTLTQVAANSLIRFAPLEGSLVGGSEGDDRLFQWLNIENALEQIAITPDTGDEVYLTIYYD